MPDLSVTQKAQAQPLLPLLTMVPSTSGPMDSVSNPTYAKNETSFVEEAVKRSQLATIWEGVEKKRTQNSTYYGTTNADPGLSGTPWEITPIEIPTCRER